MSSAKEIRQRLEVSMAAAAVGAGVAEATLRVYEVDAMAVSPKSRAKLDAYYATLRDRLRREVRA